MYLRQALESVRQEPIGRSEAAANLSLWDAHQRISGHPELAPIPSWQVPAPRAYVPPKRDWRDVRAALLGHLLQFVGACALAAAVFIPAALHLG